MLVFDESSVSVDEPVWVELPGVRKDFWVVHHVVEVWEDHGVGGEVVPAVGRLDVIRNPVRDGQANYCRKPVRKEVISLGNEELLHKSIANCFAKHAIEKSERHNLCRQL